MRIPIWYRCGLLLIAFTATGCSGRFYYPSRKKFSEASAIPEKPEVIRFHSKNGRLLSGWYFHHKGGGKPDATVVFFHGNAENLTTHYRNLVWLLDHPYDFFIFDYEGYGDSEGNPSPKNTVEDGMAALEWAFGHLPDRPLVVFGQSLGGAVALRAVAEENKRLPIKLVAVDSTFRSYREMAATVLDRSPYTRPLRFLATLLLSDAWAPIGHIASIAHTFLLVIHGDQDEIVPFSQGELVFGEGGEPKEFWQIPGGHHTDGFAPGHEEYRTRFLERMNQAVKGRRG